MRLLGEVAIVTGAAQGIGAAIADALEGEGAKVARSDLAGMDIEMDVRDRLSVQHAVDGVAATLGEPTILVNNAGINRIGPSEAIAEELWQEVIEVNLTGTFRCCQVVGGRMLAAGRGAIVNVASISAEVGMPGRAAYCSSKSGVVGMTRALAVEWAARGVRVNAVAPGYVRTPMIENALAQGLLDESGLLERVPAGRLASPEDVARAVVFLVSSEAGYVTGQTLFVDGGWLAYGAAGPASTAPTTTYLP